MPQIKFTTEIEMLLNGIGKLRMNYARIHFLFVLRKKRFENAIERVGLHIPLAEHERIARRDVELHTGYTRSILAAVVLLLHQEKKFKKSPEWRAVFLLVVRERFQQPDNRDAAFMCKTVAHAVGS